MATWREIFKLTEEGVSLIVDLNSNEILEVDLDGEGQLKFLATLDKEGVFKENICKENF